MTESYEHAAAARGHPPILVLGRDDCEDTTRSRAHLEARGIPFEYRKVDEDPEADAHIRSLNDGHWRTPTILFGHADAPYRILREPSNDELDDALGA
jgi:glutaredoxin